MTIRTFDMVHAALDGAQTLIEVFLLFFNLFHLQLHELLGIERSKLFFRQLETTTLLQRLRHLACLLELGSLHLLAHMIQFTATGLFRKAALLGLGMLTETITAQLRFFLFLTAHHIT